MSGWQLPGFLSLLHWLTMLPNLFFKTQSAWSVRHVRLWKSNDNPNCLVILYRFPFNSPILRCMTWPPVDRPGAFFASRIKGHTGGMFFLSLKKVATWQPGGVHTLGFSSTIIIKLSKLRLQLVTWKVMAPLGNPKPPKIEFTPPKMKFNSKFAPEKCMEDVFFFVLAEVSGFSQHQ